jgi:hypothetical protein
VLRHVREPAERRVVAQHRIAGSGAAAYGIDDRQSDGEHDSFEHADDHDPDRYHGRDGDLDPIDGRQDAPRRDVDQPDGGRDDRGAEHRFGKVGDRGGEKQQDSHDGGGGQQGGHLAARPHRVIDGSP